MKFTEAMQVLQDFYDGKVDWTYSELWQELIGKKLSEDEGRKRYYGAASLLELYEAETTKDIQLLKDERAAMKDDYRKIVRFERLEEIINQTVSKMPELEKLRQLDFDESQQEKMGILQLSDWHYGLSFTNVVNKFNPEEAIERVITVVDKAIKIIKSQQISKLYVFVQGDMISGNIHNILRLQNQEDLIEQITGVAEVLALLLNKLSEYTDTKVVLIGGNHERVTPKKDDNLGHENYIKLIEWYLRERLKNNDRIGILQHQDYDTCYLKIYGFNVGVIHGDKDKLNATQSNLNNLYGVNFDFIFTAHNHFTNYMDNGCCRVVSNSSLCGVDDYAKDLRAVSYAAQNFSVLLPSGELAVMPLFCKNN